MRHPSMPAAEPPAPAHRTTGTPRGLFRAQRYKPSGERRAPPEAVRTAAGRRPAQPEQAGNNPPPGRNTPQEPPRGPAAGQVNKIFVLLRGPGPKPGQRPWRGPQAPDPPAGRDNKTPILLICYLAAGPWGGGRRALSGIRSGALFPAHPWGVLRHPPWVLCALCSFKRRLIYFQYWRILAINKKMMTNKLQKMKKSTSYPPPLKIFQVNVDMMYFYL